VAEELDGGGGYSAGSVYLGVGLDLDQIDKDALAIPAKVQAIKDIRIPVKLCADEDHFRRSVDDLRRIKIDCIPIRFCLDEDALYGDLARIRRNVAENPIKVGFDTSAIAFVRAEVESLRRETVDLKGSFSFDTASVRAELESVRSLADEIAATPRRIYYTAEVAAPQIQKLKSQIEVTTSARGLADALSPELKKAFKEASKDLKGGNILGAVGNIAAAPFRAAGGVISQSVGGAIFGVSQQLTKDFGQGLATSLGGKLEGSIGSPQYFGEKVGDAIANAAQSVIKKSVQRFQLINDSVDEILADPSVLQESLKGFEQSLKIQKDTIKNLPSPLIGIAELYNDAIDSLKIPKNAASLAREFQPDLLKNKALLEQFVQEETQLFLDAFEQIFPETERITEAAAQRAKTKKRRTQAKALAAPQIVSENQPFLQDISRQQASLNQQLEQEAGQYAETLQSTRAARRQIAGQLKGALSAKSDPALRKDFFTGAAQSIVQEAAVEIAEFQAERAKTLQAIVNTDSEISSTTDPVALKALQANRSKLVQQAKEQQNLVKRYSVQSDKEASIYLSASKSVNSESTVRLLDKVAEEAKQAIRAVGEPLQQARTKRDQIQDELAKLQSQRDRAINKFKATSTTELQRQGIQSSITQKESALGSVSSLLISAQSSRRRVTIDDENYLKTTETLDRSIADLSKQKATLERKIDREKIRLDRLPQEVAPAVQEIFDVVLGATVPLEKLPAVIIDDVRAVKRNADAFYSAFENAIIINKTLAAQIEEGQLTGQQLNIKLEEVSHALQLDYGSARGLEAVSTRRGDSIQSVNPVARPTEADQESFAPELALYDSRNRLIELEAKVNAKKKQSIIEETRQSKSLVSALESSAGVGGSRFLAVSQGQIKQARQKVELIERFAQKESLDISETTDAIRLAIAELENDVLDSVRSLGRVSTQPLPLSEVEAINTKFRERFNEVLELGAELNQIAKDLQEQAKQAKQAIAQPLPSAAASGIIPPAKAEITQISSTSFPITIGGALANVTEQAIAPAAKQAGAGVVALSKGAYRAVEALESLVLDIIPAGRTLKATTKFAVKNVALPTGAAIAASQIPGVGGLETAAISAAGHLVQSLIGLTEKGVATQIQSVVSSAIPSFLPGSQNIVQSLTGHITELVTGVLDATGTATAEGLATVLSGSTILNILKKSVERGVSSASRALPAAGQSLLNTPQAQGVLNTPLPFQLPSKDQALEFAENAGIATRGLVDSTAKALEPITSAVNDAAHSVQQVDRKKLISDAAELGMAARGLVDRTVGAVESAIESIELATAKLPGGQRLADLAKSQLEGLKRQLETKFERASAAEAAGQAVIGGSDSIRGDINRVQQVIEAKAETVSEPSQKIKISKNDYESDIKKIIQSESSQIKKLRSRLAEELNAGQSSAALSTAGQLKEAGQSAALKLEKFRSNQQFDLSPDIQRSLNSYIGKFRGLIKDAEDAVSKSIGQEDYGELLSVNTKLIAERFVGLVNTLFEVEGKTLQESLGKAARSPRGKDLFVNTAGFVGSQVAGQHGIVPQLGGDIGGAITARGAIHVGGQALEARAELLGTELYDAASTIEKLKLVTEKTIKKLQQQSVQGALGDRLTEDLSGFTVGNLAGIIGNKGIEATLGGSVPGLGAIAAGGVVPKLADIRKEINARLAQVTQPQGESEEGILRSIKKPVYSDKDVEVLKDFARQLKEIERLTQRIEGNFGRINNIEKNTVAQEERNRRSQRFIAVEADRSRRTAALEVQPIKQQIQAQEIAERKAANRFTQSDVSTILETIKPKEQAQTNQFEAIKKERNAEQLILADRLRNIKNAGAAEREADAKSLLAKGQSLTERLSLIKKEAELEAKAIVQLPRPKLDPIATAAEEGRRAAASRRNQLEARLIRARQDSPIVQASRNLEVAKDLQKPLVSPVTPAARSIERPDDITSRLGSLKAEAEAKQSALTANLEAINAERLAAKEAINERIADVKALAEAEKAQRAEAIADRLEQQKFAGIRQRIGVAKEPTPPEDLSRFLTRVPGTSAASGGSGGKPPKRPIFDIPEIEPPISLGSTAAKGLLAVLEKIPQPIKDSVGLLLGFTGGAFAAVQAVQFIGSELKKNFEAAQKLQSQTIRLTFALDGADRADLALKKVKETAFAYSTNLDIARDSYFDLANQTKGTSLEKSTQKIIDAQQAITGGLDLSPDKQKSLSETFATLAASPKPYATQLKRELGTIGISYDSVARSVGYTSGELSELTRKGALLTDQILPGMADSLGNKFAIAAIASADSVQGFQNRVENAATELREKLGTAALPIAVTGMKALTGVLEFASNNASVLSGLISSALVVAIVGLAAAAKDFIASNFGGVLASLGKEAKLFLTELKAGPLLSSFGSALGKIALQIIAVQLAFSSFSAISDRFKGTERLQEYERQIGAVQQRLKELGATKVEPPKSSNDFGKDSALSLFGLNVGGFLEARQKAIVEEKRAKGEQLTGVNDLLPNAKDKPVNGFQSFFGSGPVATFEQQGNTEILEKAQKDIKNPQLTKDLRLGGNFANQINNNIQVDRDSGAENGLTKVKARLETFRQGLLAIPEDLRKTNPIYQQQIDSIDKVVKNLNGLGSAYIKLRSAQVQYNEVNKRTLDKDKSIADASFSKQRSSGDLGDFDFGQKNNLTQIEFAQKNNEFLKKLVKDGQSYVNSVEYQQAITSTSPEVVDVAKQAFGDLLEAEKNLADGEKQVEDLRTQQRLDGYTRRTDLLQREVAAQERLTSRREGQRKLTTTDRDAGLSLGAARLEISPQDLKLQQIQSQEDDATFAFKEGYKKRADAVRNLKQAQFDLNRINPNDEQQYESGKAAVAQYEQAVLAAGAEINSQQKAFSDAQLARIQEEQAQTSILIDQAVRKTELGVQKRINANNNIAASQKRQFDAQVTGLERVNKLVGKQNELTQAQANLAQTRGNGRLSGLKSAEDLAQQVKDLDPKKKEETPQDKEKKRDRLGGILDRIGLGRDPEKIFQKEVTAANDLAKIKAKALNAEIRGAEITLEIEQRKEKIARERAVRETESAKRSAQLGVDKASIGVKAAEIRLSLAKESGDPNKVNEAQLNLEQAKLDFESAAIELPNAANSVNEALLDLANSIRESALQKELGGVSAESKRTQFGLEERDRVTSTQVEAANKGFNFGRTRVQDQSGLVPLRGITLRNDPIYRSGVKESRFEAAEERSIARQRPENLQFNDRANNIKTFASYGLNLRPGESLGNLAKFNGLGAPSVAPPDLSRLLQTPSFSASTPTQNEQVTFDPSGQIVDVLNRLLQIEQAMNSKLASLVSKELTATVQVNGTSGNDDVQIRGGR
jgi:hypothetical protein